MDVVTYALAQKYVKNAIGSLDTVTDVTVDGNSVVNEDGVAEIVTPQILGEVADVKVNGQSVVDSEGVANITMHDTTLAKNFADEYDASTSYEVGDLCIKDLVLYRCTTATTGTWDDTKWEEVTVDGVLDEAGKVDDVQTYGGNTLVTNKIADLSALTIKKSIPSTPTAIATFADGAEMVMPSLTVGVEPQQDLHGYDSPWVGGAGKNKLPMTVEGIKAVNTYHSWSGNSTTINNVTITIETSDSGDVTGIRFNGTTSVDITFNLASNIIIPNGSYVWSNDQIVNISNLWLSLTSPNIAITLSSGKERNVTVSNGSIGSAYIYASSGNTFNNVVFKPMIRLASVTDATFEPYSNICPISGWDEVNVTRCGANLFDKTTISENKIINNNTGEETASYNRFSSDYIKVNPSTAYYASNLIKSAQWYCAFYYDKNKNYLSCGELPSTGDTASGVLTTPSNCNYVRLVGITTYKDDVSFVVGNAQTTYEPYNGSTYTTALKDGNNQPLTCYGGELQNVNGVQRLLNSRVKLTNDYLVNTALYESAGRGCFALIGITLKSMGSDVVDTKLMASALKTSSQNDLYTNKNVGIAHWWNTRIGFSTGDETITTVSAFKQWLADNGSDVVYELATPITVQLTPTAVKSLEGENNLFADSGQIIEGEYLADASTVIAGLDARITALENV